MAESKLKVKTTSKQKTKTGETNQKATSTESEEDEEFGVREKSDVQKKDNVMTWKNSRVPNFLFPLTKYINYF